MFLGEKRDCKELINQNDNRSDKSVKEIRGCTFSSLKIL